MSACLLLAFGSLVSVSFASSQEAAQQSDVYESREAAIASVGGTDGRAEHQIVYQHGKQQKLVAWVTSDDDPNACSVAIFAHDESNKGWRRIYRYRFEEILEIAVELRKEHVRLRNSDGDILFDDKREARRFKGVELYSWKTKDGDWKFALLEGTNRLKSIDEIKSAADHVESLETIKKAISQLAIGETVMWNPLKRAAFSMPDLMLRQEIIKSAQQAGIRLEID